MKRMLTNTVRATCLCLLLMGGAPAFAQTLQTHVVVDNVALSVRALPGAADASYALVPWYSSLDSEVQDFHNGSFADHRRSTDAFPLDAEVRLPGAVTGGQIASLLGAQTLDTQLDSHSGDYNYAHTESRVLNWVYVSPHTELTLSGHVAESVLGFGSERSTMAIVIAQLQWNGNSNIFYRFLTSTGAPQQLDELFHVTLVNDSDLTVPMTMEFNGYATAGPLGAVPEPERWAMLAGGLGWLGLRRRVGRARSPG